MRQRENMFKSIALDIGGVCLHLHPEKVLKAVGCLNPDDIPIEFIAATDMLEKGTLNTADWLNVFQEATGNKFSDRELLGAWAQIIGRTVEGMPELAHELVDAGYKLVFFSDTSEFHIQEVYRRLTFANLVTGCVFSYETGAKKPDEAMYRAFESEYGKPVFYTDDHPANVEGGIRCGWNSHLFTSAENMRSALIKAKILHCR